MGEGSVKRGNCKDEIHSPVKKGIISDNECNSYTKMVKIDHCMMRKVSQFDEYFITGTVLLSKKSKL